jgi:uncharacterized protein with GYD domain
MARYFLFGRYTAESIAKVSPERTKKAYEVVTRHGGKIESIFALLGEHDLVIQAELPGTEEAMKASVALTRATGISFSTHAALPVERFDQVLKDA